jgi:hypothetical protein
MKKSQLIKIIKEEVTKALQEKTKEKLQISLSAKDFMDIGVPSNIAPKVLNTINKLRNPQGVIDDVSLSNDDNKALARAFIEMIASEDINKLNAFMSKIKAAKTVTIDTAG